METVLVTGVSGHVGPQLANQVVSSGFAVRGLVRSKTQFEGVAAQGLDPVLGDVTQPETLDAALQGVDFVLHCAAYAGPDMAVSEAINVEGTRALATKALRANVERFVHISTVSVHGSTLPRHVDEESPLVSSDPAPYCVTKARGELALAEVRAQGLETVVLRPGMITNVVRSQWGNEMVQRIRSKGWPKDLHPDDRMPWVHTRNLAEMSWLALTHPAAANQTFLAVDRNVAMKEFFGPIAEALGQPIVTPERPPELSDCRLGKLASVLGYRPVRSFEETMAGLLELARNPPE